MKKLLHNSDPRRKISLFLHLIVLALSLYLVISISIDTFRDINVYSIRFISTQFYICIAFIMVFLIEMVLSRHRWRFFRNNLIFLLFSIPYQEIFLIFNVHFHPMEAYLVQFIPLVRGGYALAIVVSWFSYNKVASIFLTYVVTLLATVYFASLIFFLFEHKVNPDVTIYGDALWWALMDTTTVGSYISPMTYIGKVLAVLLAALGMMMFPIFTVYVTSLITRHRKEGSRAFSIAGVDNDMGRKDTADVPAQPGSGAQS